MKTFFRPARYRSEAKWKRAFHVSDAGQIYVPATICGLTEHYALFTSSFDGDQIITYLKHCYVTFDWLVRHCPKKRVALGARGIVNEEAPINKRQLTTW